MQDRRLKKQHGPLRQYLLFHHFKADVSWPGGVGVSFSKACAEQAQSRSKGHWSSVRGHQLQYQEKLWLAG